MNVAAHLISHTLPVTGVNTRKQIGETAFAYPKIVAKACKGDALILRKRCLDVRLDPGINCCDILGFPCLCISWG